MSITKRVGVLVMYFALVYHVDAKKKVMPVAGVDIYKDKNVAADKLSPGEKINNVLSFGAKGDGEYDCTQAFMDAWRETCHSKGNARVLVPEGRFVVSTMFFAGPCTTPDPVTIQVVGTVVATTDISEYVNGEWLMFESIDGIRLIGGGTFDGVGKESWKTSANCKVDPSDTCVRNPSSLYFRKVRNGIIQNIKSIDPKGFHVFVTNCVNIRLRLLKLVAPSESPNTDGIHISQSVNVKVSKNNIETGDDCISMIQGANDVHINKMNCGPGHGISIGSLGKYPDELEVKNISVTNISMVGTTNGVRIKTWPNKHPGSASFITFTDINMQNVQNPIIIDQEYECSKNCQNQPSLVQLKDISFSNIRGTTPTPIAVDLRCSMKFPCEKVKLENINLSLGPKPTGSRCQNIKPIYMGLQKPPTCP